MIMKKLAAIAVAWIALGATTTAFAAALEPVAWKNSANVTISGSALSKATTAPIGFWNAGASSSRAIASGYGYVRFTASAIGNSVVGLSHGDSSHAWADVDFGINLTAEGELYIVESDLYFGPYGTYGAGDVFRVEASATGSIHYIRNGAAFYTSAKIPTYPLLADTSLFTPGVGITDVSLYGTFVDSPPMDLTTASAKLFWQNSDGRRAAWFLDGATKTAEATIQATTGWRFSTLGDFNGDGRMDWMATDVGGGGYWYIEYLDGAMKISGSSLPQVADVGWRVRATGDFNGDGKTDILWRHSNGSNLVWQMNGATAGPGVPLPSVADPAWDVAGVADFDRDGRVDILWRNGATGANLVWYMNGTTKTGEAPLEPLAGSAWKSAGVGDFNADGKADVLWWNSATGALELWYLDNVTRVAQMSLPSMVGAGWSPAGYAEAMRARAVVLDPGPGTFLEPVNVAVTCPTAGSVVRYTTSGAAPTEADPVVACGGHVTIDQTATLKLRAWKPPLLPSLATTAAYVISGEVPTPTIEPAGGLLVGPQNVVIRAISGATIHYTLDGAEPTEADPTVVSGGSVLVDHALTLKAKAWRPGSTTSPTASATFQFTIPAPVFIPPAGSFAVTEDIALTTSTAGAVIRYTTNGGEPDELSTIYTGPITVTAATTIRAKAFKEGFVPSATASATYTPVAPRFEAVTEWRNKINVAFATPNTFYKSGGGDEGWTAGASSVKAIAGGEGYVEFTAAGGDDGICAETVVGLSHGDSNANISDIDFGINLTGGGRPIQAIVKGVVAWVGWGVPCTVGDRMSVGIVNVAGQPRVRFYRNDVLLYESTQAPTYPLVVDTSIYSIYGYVENVKVYGILTTGTRPVAAPGGPYTEQVGAPIGFNGSGSQATEGTLVSYSWAFGDGTTASGATVSHAYAAAGTYTVRLTVLDSNGHTATASTTATITGYVPMPTIAPAGAILLSPQNVVIQSVPGATLHYTTNGNEPTEADPTVASGGSVLVDRALILKVKAWRPGFTPSPTATAVFDFTIPAPVFSPPPGPFVLSEDVVLSTATAQATIRYTTDGSEPTDTSTVYSAPITVTAATTFRAKAFKAGFVSSATAIGAYTPAQPAAESVTQWRNVINLTVSGNNLQHTGVADGGSASSVKAIAAGSGFVEFTAGGPVGEEDGNPRFGESSVALRNGSTRFGFYFHPFGHVTAFVAGGSSWGGWGQWFHGGDRFRIEVADVAGQSRARFYWNGTMVHDAPATPVYPLVTDVGISGGGSIQDVVMYGLLTAGTKPIAVAGGPYASRTREIIRFGGAGSYAVEGSLVSHNWSFGDGTTGTGASVDHTYPTPGTYNVRLTVVDSNGRTGTSHTTANVSDGGVTEPVFWRNVVNLTPLPGGGPGAVWKTAGNGDAWDAGASSRKAIASGSGSFEFTTISGESKVVAGLNNGDRSLGAEDIDFGIELGPDGHFGIREGAHRLFVPDPRDDRFARPYGSPQHFRISVDASSGTPVVRYYHQGELVYTSTRTPVYPLNADLTVAHHNNGISAPVLSGLLTVSYEPIASLGGPYRARPNELIQFDGTGSYDSDGGAITSYTWDFGDGATATSPTPTHIYAEEGSYALTLTVLDSSGHASTAATTVTISDAPVSEQVRWRNMVRAELLPGGGGGVWKTAGTDAWDAGASSVQAIAHGGGGGLEFTVGAPESDLVIGLSNGDRSVDPADIDFGIVLAADGQVWIREGTATIGPFGKHVGYDKFVININPANDVVQYLKNSYVFYTSGRILTYPLVADVSIKTFHGAFLSPVIYGALVPHQLPRPSIKGPLYGDPGQLLEFDASGSYSPSGAIAAYEWKFVEDATLPQPTASHVYTAPGTYRVTLTVTDTAGYTASAIATVIIRPSLPRLDVIWKNLVGVTRAGSTVTKTDTEAGWISGAFSKKWLTSGDGYVEVIASETTTHRAFGLNRTDRSRLYTDIQFGIMMSAGGGLGVIDRNLVRGPFESYVPGDRLRVEIRSGVIFLKRNNTIFYISHLPPVYPLFVDTSLYHMGATLTNVTFAGNFTNSVPASRPLAYRSWVGDSVEFDGNRSYDVDGEIVSYEWSFGDGQTATGPQVFHAYTQEGTYSAALTVTDNEGAVHTAATTVTIDPPPPPVNMVWENVVGLEIQGAGAVTSRIRKSSESGQWSAGAVSRKGIQSGRGYVEFAAGETVSHRAIGLNDSDADQTLADLDYALHLHPNGGLTVVERGQTRITLAPYSVGDRLRVEVANGVVRYKKNGITLYRSPTAATYPLYVDLSFASPGGELVAVELIGTHLNDRPVVIAGGPYSGNPGVPITFDGRASFDTDGTIASHHWSFGDGTAADGALVTHTYLAPGTYAATLTAIDDEGASTTQLFTVSIKKRLPLSEVVWEQVVKADVDGNSLAKSLGEGWDAGAVSRQVIDAGEGYVEFTARETDRLRACGLSAAAPKLFGIDFAFVLRADGTLQVQEAGVIRVDAGTYAAGDRLRIEVASGTVRYKRNGTVLYSSSVPPRYPLRADAALHGTGASIRDAVISGDLGAERRLAPPVASPGGGVFTGPQGVSLWSRDAGVEIRYTLDGSEPTNTSPLFTAAIEIAEATTLKARTFRANWEPSEMYVAEYSFQQGVLPAPRVTPAGGTYAEPVSVALACPAGASIRFTSDGSAPTEASPAYSAPINVATSQTVQARCVAPGWSASHTARARFVIGEANDTTAPSITLLEPTNAVPVP
jgi:PKD repeat protein